MTDSSRDLFDVIHRQRACRQYADRELDDETVGRILDAATFAPSAENRQPWVFVVVRDPVTQAAIHDLTERAWAAGGRDFAAQRVEQALFEEVDAGVAGGGYRSAPVLVIVAADTERCLPQTIDSSIFPATQNLLLAATALDVGSALTTLTLGFGKELAELVGLPEHVVPQVVVPLGHPAKALKPPRREPWSDHTHRDRYGTPFSSS